MKTRVSRKHKEETAENFRQTCNFCKTVFNNKKEMRIHLKKRSYNSIDIKAFKYKCSECEFLEENETTMEVHVSRKHGEKFECELCKYEAKDLENLDLHIFTREMYRCEKCDYKCNSISDIRTHINEVHGNAKDKRDIFLEHCRKNSNEISKSRHWRRRLFPEIKN